MLSLPTLSLRERAASCALQEPSDGKSGQRYQPSDHGISQNRMACENEPGLPSGITWPGLRCINDQPYYC